MLKSLMVFLAVILGQFAIIRDIIPGCAWLGYNLVKVSDDRLSRLGTIHQRDRHTDNHTDSRIATANVLGSATIW